MIDSKIEIVKAALTDVDELQKFGIQTYSETFAPFNTEDNMRAYLETSFNREQLLHELENANSGFYFAKIADEIAGYMKINFGDAQTDIKDIKSMEIERIYAAKEFYGKGIGQLLCNKAFQLAVNAGVEYIWLGVWEKNFRAQKFYEKNGFIKFSEHIFMLGDDAQVDLLMKKVL